jgi:hypothetical protein
MIPKDKRKTKLYPHSAEGRLLSYNQRGYYQIYDVSTKKIIISRDVIFNKIPIVSILKASKDLDARK